MVVIHRGLPIPPRAPAGAQSKYAAIWADLGKGDCAELPDRQANGLASWCKKQQHAYALRRLSPSTKGVWREA